MTNLLRSCLVVSAFLVVGQANAACKISTDWDFAGQTRVVQDNDYWRFTVKDSPEDRHLPAKKNRTFWDASWYNKVSAVELTPNCKAVFFMTPGLGQGHVAIKETTQRFPENLNDKTQGMVCECTN